MNKNTLALNELTAGAWLIDAQAGALAFETLYQHGAPVDSTAYPNERHMAFFQLDYQTVQLKLSDAPDGAGLLVLEIDGMLYSWSAQWIEAELAYGARRAEVLGAIIRVNCPGGLEHAAYRVHDAIKAFQKAGKPVAVYCDHGMLGSAAYLFASPADRIVASRATDEIGSIGAYTTFTDRVAALKGMGYNAKEVYAPQSTEKNSEYRAAQDGNFKPLAALMAQKADFFISTVQTNRPQVKAGDAGDPLKGGLFTADTALTLGLIDAVGTLPELLEATLTLVAESSNYLQSQETMFGFLKIPALLAVKGVAADQITPEQIDTINAELSAAGIDGLAIVSQAQFTQAVESANSVQGIQAQLTAKDTELADLKTKVTTLEGEKTSLTAQVAQLGTQPGAVPTNPHKPGQEGPEGSTSLAAKVIAELPYQKALDNNPMFN